jgi:ferredoxin
MTSHLLPKARLDDLLRLLTGDGFEVVGPRLEQGAIVYAPLRSAVELPIGWTDRQEPGSYRLEKRQDDAYFGYAVGPHSWKKYLFPAALRLWEARREGDGFTVHADEPDPPRRAFLGVRSCELHAIAVQDRVFLGHEGGVVDPHYAAARARLFLIAVECESPAGTCFCTSMGTGPSVEPERVPRPEPASPSRRSLPLVAESAPLAQPVCDLILTELADAFVIRAASPAGQGVLDRLGLTTATTEQVAESRQRVEAAAKSMTRRIDATDLHGLLHRNLEHPRWDDVASRCLSCTNCTLVCPTCFCSTTEDTSDPSMETAARMRRWDSCFTPEFGRVHGGNFRPSTRGRYRQWLTHKFASWFDQFGLSGCVGCGRCIAWCPVGIDVTEELTAIRATDGQRPWVAAERE